MIVRLVFAGRGVPHFEQTERLCPLTFWVKRAFACLGVIPGMVDVEYQPEPVTAVEAGLRLNKSAATIRYWVIRYSAVQLGKHGRAVYYDFDDLTSIERSIRLGEPVPDSVERAEHRERTRRPRVPAA